MAYTRPSPSAAELTWVGQSGYTRPAPGAAALAFAVSNVATGFRPTNFGTPHAVFTQFAQPAGFKPTNFGTPGVVFTQFAHPAGFKPVNFGLVAVAVAQFAPVSGFAPVRFGTTTITGAYPVVSFRPVHFGAVALLPHAVGFKPVHFGSPGMAIDASSLRPVQFGLPLVTTANKVASWRAMHAGTPTVATNRTCQPSGFQCARFGYVAIVHLARRQRHIHGMVYRLRPANFGTPAL